MNYHCDIILYTLCNSC